MTLCFLPLHAAAIVACAQSCNQESSILMSEFVVFEIKTFVICVVDLILFVVVAAIFEKLFGDSTGESGKTVIELFEKHN